MKFDELIKNNNILHAINDLEFESMTEIQEKIIPLIQSGFDVLGKSKTGTGKTLAFIAPILESIENNNELQVVILSPTRELAIQISRDTNDISKYTNIKNCCVYGSSNINDQIKSINKGVEIVIGTPGRVKDLIKRKVLKLNNIKYFVLDEADEMLSMGFQDELEYIFESTNINKQVLLFSATMPKTIIKMAEKYISKKYKTINLDNNKTATADNIDQYYYLIDDKSRMEAMCRVMDYYNPDKAIIFCRTKRNADEVFSKLNKKGYSSDVIHGDIAQAQRINTLDRFKDGNFNYLIATDVAARGIHVDNISLIINYNLPESNEAYIHRIGRTGRAKKSGTAVSFIKKSEINILISLKKYINADIIESVIPTKDQIINNKVISAIKEVDLCKDDNNYDYFKDYILSLTEEEKSNILGSLLSKSLLTSLSSYNNNELNINNKKSDKKLNRNSSDSIRVFLTIGKLDKIEKRKFLEFIEKKANVKESTCSNLEIMTKFTFMNVKTSEYEKVFNAINNCKYNGRIIKIEKAKK